MDSKRSQIALRFKQAKLIWTILLVSLVFTVVFAGVLNFNPGHSVLASTCTLTIETGHVQVQTPDASSWKEAVDGEILQAGTRIVTSEGTEALLTFFEGSTIRLEQNTDIEIKQIEYIEEKSTVIVLYQWVGTTWSRVVEMADPDSRYEIQTPSATALVRGTYFKVTVDEAGFTTVDVFEGSVIVTGRGEGDEEPEDDIINEENGVIVPFGYRIYVESGSLPSNDQLIPLDGDSYNGEEDNSGDDDTPATPEPGTLTPTPDFECTAYITFAGHPGEHALVAVTGNGDKVTTDHGLTVNLDFQIEYTGPLSPVLGRPVLYISDLDSNEMISWSMSEEGDLKVSRDSVEPYPVYIGSKYVFNISWDLTDYSGQHVPPGEYVVQATVESPYSYDSSRFHLLDYPMKKNIHIVATD